MKRAGGLGRRGVLAAVVAGALALSVPAGAVAGPLERAAAPRAQLERTDTVTLATGATIDRYAQVVDGVEVDGAEVVVVDTAGGAPTLVVDETRSDVDPPADPDVSRRAAVRIAREATGVTATIDAPGIEPVIAGNSGGTLAWRVTLASRQPLGDFEVIVDAVRGDVLAMRNRLRRATGSAKLFLPNAVVANDGYAGLHDRRDRDYRKLTQLRAPVTLENLEDGQNCLVGDWAKSLQRGDRVCRSSLNWNDVTRASGRFEALMAYHHTDRTQAYIQSLDITASPGDLNDERQLIDANTTAQDNSFYFPGADRIELGTGGVDDGEDADVIVHEYGHALQDAQVPGFGESFAGGAMGEGFGDYLAAAMTKETAPSTSSFFNNCVMEWDATSYDPRPSCLRRTNRTRDRHDQAQRCGHEVHCVGETWSSALWALRLELGDDPSGNSVMDRVAITSHFLLDPDPGWQDAAHALEQADEMLYPDGAPDDGEGMHFAAIREEMRDRDFLP